MLLLCLSAVIALAASGGEQAAPVADTPVPVEPKAVSATFSAAAEPQPAPTAEHTPRATAAPAPVAELTMAGAFIRNGL